MELIDYMTEEQLAKRLGISVRSLRNRVAQGRNHPPYIKDGRQKRFPIDELIKWERKRLTIERIRSAS